VCVCVCVKERERQKERERREGRDRKVAERDWNKASGEGNPLKKMGTEPEDPRAEPGPATSQPETKQKKKKVVMVRRANSPGKPKKHIAVARKLKPGEEIPSAITSLPSPARSKGLRRDAAGRPLARSIIGSVESFEQFERTLSQSMSGSGSKPCVPSPSNEEDESASETSRSRTPGTPGSTASTTHPLLSQQGTIRLTVEDERERYLTRLQSAMVQAEGVREEERKQEAELLPKLPLHERFTMGREGKVMARWRERQLDWEQLQRNIGRKIGRDPNKMNMALDNDFREKAEEYATIQAAVPSHERFGDSHWEMSLREYGVRLVPIGNIFSGLFCPLKSELPLPRVIRRPKPNLLSPKEAEEQEIREASKYGPVVRSWRDDPFLNGRKKRLKKHLERLRPHEITPDLSQGLIVVSRPLFQWAIQSSQAYFHTQDQGKQVDILTLDAGGPLPDESTVEAAHDSRNAFAGTPVDGPPSGPRVKVGPSADVFVKTRVGDKSACAVVELENTGSSTLFFEWNRVKEQPSLVDASKQRTLASDGLPHDASAEHWLSHDPVGDKFLCRTTKGQLLPGESRLVSFTFVASASGLFAERWRIQVTPRPVFESGGIAESSKLGAAGHKGRAVVTLHGSAQIVDEQEHDRLSVRSMLGRSGATEYMRGMLSGVLRNVRTPEREADRWRHEQTIFLQANGEAGLAYSPTIFDGLADVWRQGVELSHEAGLGPGEVTGLGRKALVPNLWDGRVESIHLLLDAIAVPARTATLLEDPNSSPSVSSVKSGGDGASEAGAVSEDVDDEEEEEDDEEDEETEGGEVKPTRPLSHIERSGMEDKLRELWESLHVLATKASVRPLPSTRKLVAQALTAQSIADAIVDAVESARAEHNVVLAAVGEGEGEEEVDEQVQSMLRPLPSPFTGGEGLTLWKEVVGTGGGHQEQGAVREEGEVEGEEDKEEACEPRLSAREVSYRSAAFKAAMEGIAGVIGTFSSLAYETHAAAQVEYYQRTECSQVVPAGSLEDAPQAPACLRLPTDVAGKRVLVQLDLDLGQWMQNPHPKKQGPENLLVPTFVDPDVEAEEEDAQEGNPAGPPPPSNLLAAAKLLRKVAKAGARSTLVLSRLSRPASEGSEEKSGRADTEFVRKMSLRSAAPALEKFSRCDVAFCASMEEVKEELAAQERAERAAIEAEEARRRELAEKRRAKLERKKAKQRARARRRKSSMDSDDEEESEDEDSDEEEGDEESERAGGAKRRGRPRLVLLEHSAADTMVPLPVPVLPRVAPDEEEELPWLGEPEDDPALDPAPPPVRPNILSLLAPFVDLIVVDSIVDADDPTAAFPPASEVAVLPPPLVSPLQTPPSPPSEEAKEQRLAALRRPRVAGPHLHQHLLATGRLDTCAGIRSAAEASLEGPGRSPLPGPVVCIAGGCWPSIEAELVWPGSGGRLVDRFLDLADEVVVTGDLALPFLAVLGHSVGAAKYCHRYFPPGPIRLPEEGDEEREQFLNPKRGEVAVESRFAAALQVARTLIAKAHSLGVRLILPVDLVCGDVLVDAEGPVRRAGFTVDQKTSEDDDEDEEDDLPAPADEEEDDPPDEAAGFDYDGDMIECALSEGIPGNVFPQDIGSQTTTLIRDAVDRARTVLWHGLPGATFCGAFQAGTRELLDAVSAIHADRGAKVFLAGDDLCRWADLFAVSEVTHVFAEGAPFRKGFCRTPLPGVLALTQREIAPGEELLKEEARARRLAKGLPSEDEEEEDEEEEDEEEEGGEEGEE